jgi:hypothetical protein
MPDAIARRGIGTMLEDESPFSTALAFLSSSTFSFSWFGIDLFVLFVVCAPPKI